MIGRPVQAIVLALLVVLISGCARAPRSVIPSTAPAAPAGTRPASAVVTPPPEPDYPFTLWWPDDGLVGKWKHAVAAWDGKGKINSMGAFTDHVQTTDGLLFAFGGPTSETAQDVQQLWADKAHAWHGCDVAPIDQAALSGGGADGVLAVHVCAGTTVLRWIGVRDGFGLRAALIVSSEPGTARTHFEANIPKLTWDN